MNGFKDTMKIPVAITENTPLNLDCRHITTANWMQLQPIYWKEMVPGEKLEIGVESFTRLNPLVVPSFAPGCKIKTSRFFVPFRTIFRGWNDFITDAYHVGSSGDIKDNGLLYRVPTVSNDVLLEALTTPFTDHASSPQGYGSTFAEEVEIDLSPEDEGYEDAYAAAPYDYKTEDGTKYVYTVLGRQALKVLQSLGYKINPNSLDAQIFSALPLLAYAKVYADFYWPTAYNSSYVHYYLESMFNSDNGVPLELDAEQVAKLLRYTIFVCYDSDYFVSAFDNPLAPSDNNYTSMSFVDYTLPNPFNRKYAASTSAVGNSVGTVTNGNPQYGAPNPSYSDNNGTPWIENTNNYGYPSFTQYVDTMLHRLTDYSRRHQLSGSRALERYASRFGKTLGAEKLNRSVYLGTDYTTVQIGDVMSTSDTYQEVDGNPQGSLLGAYSGKGIAVSKNDYDGFSTDEYGIYIITSSIVPEVFYDNGIDYNTLHVYKSEFWTPEFDYGVRTLQADELIIVNDGTSPYASGDIHNQTFGFTPRYSEYRFGRSRLTGNFRIPTLNLNSELGSGAWHMMREIHDEQFGHSVSNIVHSPSFVYGVTDAGQYNRLFFNSDFNAPDQFITIYSFDVKSYSPMAPLYENYDWCDDDAGREISMQVNGVKVN